ncbi:MAG: aspartate/glutamate racemase family protein [Chloroflexi bacterium]|nr:aspartate/glutamate racemase family protein [Chloroflexota bacterium]
MSLPDKSRPRIGVLGGMGPLATSYFLQRLLDEIARALHPLKDQDFPDMSVLLECSTPDRTEAILSGAPAAAKLINAALSQLVEDGCSRVVIPCVTAHALVDPTWFSNEVVDFRPCISQVYCSRHGTKVGVIGTTGTMSTGVFEPLKDRFSLCYPSDADQQLVMDVIYGEGGLKSGITDVRCAARLLETVMRRLEDQGCGAFIAGCSEIEMLVAMLGLEECFLLPFAAVCIILCRWLRERALQ